MITCNFQLICAFFQQDAIDYVERRGSAQVCEGVRLFPQKVSKPIKPNLKLTTCFSQIRQVEGPRMGGHRENFKSERARPLRPRLVLHKMRGHRQAHLHPFPNRCRFRDQDFRFSQA